jgi:hypothetical protein
MRFSLALSLLLPAAIHAFAPRPLHSRRRETILESTLAPPDLPKVSSEDDHLVEKGALSMQIDELAAILGGRGRAKIVWDCYNLGIDPADFFGPSINLGFDDYESIYNMMPSSRRGQPLGKDALAKLASLYPAGGKVEDGVASLSHISRSADSTTKLLLKLQDGLSIETVIIPWNGERSTLCVSSQVGCRQGELMKR